jgi:hypothetical protein
MPTLSLTARLIAATAAAATTLGLFSAVISNAEPQRSLLIAKLQRAEKLASAHAALVLAANIGPQQGR